MKGSTPKITANKKIISKEFKIASSSQIMCKSLNIGIGVNIGERVKIICKNEIFIDDYTYIGDDVTILLDSFKIGEYCKLHNHCLLNGKKSVSIGHNCWFGQNNILNAEENLTIGNNVGLGIYSSIWTHGYFGQLIDGCKYYTVKPTVIEDDVWLVGSYNTVFPGVKIGKRTVIMGASVVTKDIPPHRIYSGNPAKDITDKVGVPYSPISIEKKFTIIRKTLIDYFENNNIDFIQHNNKMLTISNLGSIKFTIQALPVNNYKSENIVIFCNKVLEWKAPENISLFCLKTKKYTKNRTELEVLVRKILNTTVARFIPFAENYEK